MVEIPQGADIERMTAEAAAEAQAMLAALDLEQVQRETLDAVAEMERTLSDDRQTGADAISGAAAQAGGRA